MSDFFLDNYKNVGQLQILLESVAFVFGILSVWYARKENILVYPTGIIATTITSFLLFDAGYLGDMCINFYFTIMSFYGWFAWSKMSVASSAVSISKTNFKEKCIGFCMFLVTIITVLLIYALFETKLKPENCFDVLASGIFFTAMWYMARKKLENWPLWIVGNLIVIPLYAYRGLEILSFQYIIFTILAVSAFKEWNKIYNNSRQTSQK